MQETFSSHSVSQCGPIICHLKLLKIGWAFFECPVAVMTSGSNCRREKKDVSLTCLPPCPLSPVKSTALFSPYLCLFLRCFLHQQHHLRSPCEAPSLVIIVSVKERTPDAAWQCVSFTSPRQVQNEEGTGGGEKRISNQIQKIFL